MTKLHNNHEKKYPQAAFSDLKLSYSTKLKLILRHLEKETQPEKLIDHIILAQKEGYETIKAIAMVMYNEKPKRLRRRACNRGKDVN